MLNIFSCPHVSKAFSNSMKKSIVLGLFLDLNTSGAKVSSSNCLKAHSMQFVHDLLIGRSQNVKILRTLQRTLSRWV